MSRRKQAKPRAFLKLGDECEVDPLAIHTKDELFSDHDEQSQHDDDDDNCLHQKQDIKMVQQHQTPHVEQLLLQTVVNNGNNNNNSSSNENENGNGIDNGAAAHIVDGGGDGDSDDSVPRQHTNVELINSHAANVVTLQVTKSNSATEVAAKKTKVHVVDGNGNADGDGVPDANANGETVAAIADINAHVDAVVVVAGAAANNIDTSSMTVTTSVDAELKSVKEDIENDAEFDEEFDDDDGVDDDDEEDDDLLSLDSYYSDMYSTHTSSSYSPSISDGTLTPNSLHQQHLPSTHLQHLQSLQQMHNDAAAESETTQRLKRHQTNGEPETETDVNTINTTTTISGTEELLNEPEKKVFTEKFIKSGGAESNAALEQLKRHGRHQRHHHNHHHHHALNAVHGLKIPTKLRKIERDATTGAGGGVAGAAAGGKLDKLTGESIKGSNADGSYQCQFCDKSFPRLGYLKKHEQSHAEHLPFKCEYCARLFKHKRSRDRHTKLHTGDRRYRCPHCEAAFSRSDHLKIHMKTHDNQKPFQCTICNRGYNTAAALTSHMQNHKKQAAILAAGGNPQALNYSPRSTGSASSNGSLHKRRYGIAASIASDSSPSRHDYPSKRLRPSYMNCSYCGKSDFNTLDQLNAHMTATHEKELAQLAATSTSTTTTPLPAELPAFQLACEYCTMKLPNIPALFQHMRSTHVDRLSSPNSYFEHFNRLAATGTFSPRLVQAAKTFQRNSTEMEPAAVHIKVEDVQNLSPKSADMKISSQEEEPTDLSSKRRSITPQPVERVSPQQQTQQGHVLHHSSNGSTHSSPTQHEKPDVFFCNQCNAGLPDFESFRNHLKTHITQSLSLNCHHCGCTLRDHTEYERHIISHFLITSTEYNCTGNCSKSFQKPEELQKHLLDQHVITMYKCAICAELFETKVSIQVHFACAHASESKVLRCSACMEVFRTDADFNLHVKTRHQQNGAIGGSSGGVMGNSLQCMFCRTICGSELEMHFHLAAHARQFRCPSCPETFHVEFLLDRHMQSQHGGNEQKNTPNNATLSTKDSSYEEQQLSAPGTPISNVNINSMNSLYVNALFGKATTTPLMPSLSAQNNNSSILDYNVAFAAAHLKNGLFPATAAAAAAASKFYSPLQVDTNAIKHHPALMYGLSQRYFDTNRTLLDMYAQQQQEKAANYFISPKSQATPAPPSNTPQDVGANNCRTPSEALQSATTSTMQSPAASGFSCGICERNDFRTEAEVHSHRKIVHNMKTGVSLRCAYCSGNFKSRSELEHHMKTCHNSTGKHKCLICDEIFPSPAILAEHKLQHSKVGQSGRCSHCAKPLNDVAAFKEHLGVHNTEGQMPVQCICCRQSLHSEFEVGLHAKFHTKSANAPESVCALCLEPMPNATTTEAKVCEKCCRKHNLNAKYYHHQQQQQQQQQNLQQQQQQQQLQHNKSRDYGEHATAAASRQYIENRCNLCKVILPHAQKLQEHLVEHTFAGCEERGFNCYICSAVFTATAGLLQHMTEHGAHSRPYDCNICTEKFYFRAELDHHLVEHELRDINKMRQEIERPQVKERNSSSSNESRSGEYKLSAKNQSVPQAPPRLAPQQVKQELLDEADNKSNVGDDDEYIEVEKVAENGVGEKHHEKDNNTTENGGSE